MPASRSSTSQSPRTLGSVSCMPWSATSTNAVSSNTPARSTAASTSPTRASESRTDASAISENGPPSWNAESVSVKLHHMNIGFGNDTSRYCPLQMPTACSTPMWSTTDDHE